MVDGEFMVPMLQVQNKEYLNSSKSIRAGLFIPALIYTFTLHTYYGFLLTFLIYL